MSTYKMNLGNAAKDEIGGLHGKLNWLGMGSVDFLGENAVSAKGESYLKLIADPLGEAYEIGAAFPKEKDGTQFYSVRLDSPLFPSPVTALLYPDKTKTNSFDLTWNRQELPKPAATATVDAGQDETQVAAMHQKPSGALRRENTRLKMEHEILKKTVGIFSETRK